MELYTCRIAGREVNPATVSPPDLNFGRNVGAWSELPYELSFDLWDLRDEFRIMYAEWIDDALQLPDPDDELEVVLHHLDWPTLDELAAIDAGVLAAVLLNFGYEVLHDLERSRDASARVEFTPISVDEVEVRGTSTITLRGRALLVHYENRLTIEA
jgi:hypothetical protein